MDVTKIIESGANIKLEVSSQDIKDLVDTLSMRIKEDILEHVSSIQAEKRFYTREEVMNMFHIKETTLHNYVKSGKLKMGCLSGRKLFSSYEIDRFIHEHFPNG